MGYPSSVVITAAGVPGIRSNVALINPPLTAPTYMPINSTSADTGSISKVKGNANAMSIVPVKPGTAPTKIPKAVPTRTAPILFGDTQISIM